MIREYYPRAWQHLRNAQQAKTAMAPLWSTLLRDSLASQHDDMARSRASSTPASAFAGRPSVAALIRRLVQHERSPLPGELLLHQRALLACAGRTGQPSSGLGSPGATPGGRRDAGGSSETTMIQRDPQQRATCPSQIWHRDVPAIAPPRLVSQLVTLEFLPR